MVWSITVAMRSICLYILVSLTSSFAVMADPVPIDPQILIDTGGDAMPITGPSPIIIGPNGGGIFAFQNETGGPLSEIDVKLVIPITPLNIAVQGTWAPTMAGQAFSFEPITTWNSNCAGFSTVDSCVDLQFSLIPGPLIPTGGTFILDFDNNASTVDQAELQECIAGTNVAACSDSSGTGGWGMVSSAMVDPISAVPEPAYRATAGFLGLTLLAAWNYRRRLTAKKS
jgi:hypothetical protein